MPPTANFVELPARQHVIVRAGFTRKRRKALKVALILITTAKVKERKLPLARTFNRPRMPGLVCFEHSVDANMTV